MPSKITVNCNDRGCDHLLNLYYSYYNLKINLQNVERFFTKIFLEQFESSYFKLPKGSLIIFLAPKSIKLLLYKNNDTKSA